MVTQMALFLVKGLRDAEVFIVGFALVGKLTLPLAYFHIDLRIPLPFLANDVAHTLVSPNIWYSIFYLPLNVPIVKGKDEFFIRKNV